MMSSVVILDTGQQFYDPSQRTFSTIPRQAVNNKEEEEEEALSCLA